MVLPSTRWLFDFLFISLGPPGSVLATAWELATEHVWKTGVGVGVGAGEGAGWGLVTETALELELVLVSEW